MRNWTNVVSKCLHTIRGALKWGYSSLRKKTGAVQSYNWNRLFGSISMRKGN
jgi:hypothetical protein